MSRKHSLTVRSQNRPWTRYKESLPSPPVRFVMRLTTAGTQSTTNEVKTKGHIVIPYIQGLCKSIKSVVGMAYRPLQR